MTRRAVRARAERAQGTALAKRLEYRKQGAWELCQDPFNLSKVYWRNSDTGAIRSSKPQGWKDDPAHITQCSCCGIAVSLGEGGHGKMHHVTRDAQSLWPHRAD